MRKKDYELIGTAIKQAWKHTQKHEGFDTSKIESMSLVMSLSDALTEDNAKFNEQKFIDFIKDF